MTPNTPVAMMCISSAQLFSSWLMSPEDVSNYYIGQMHKRFEIYNNSE